MLVYWRVLGGFNPSEKYESNWIISPSRGENRKYFKKKPPSIITPPKTNGWNLKMMFPKRNLLFQGVYVEVSC